jgi:alkylation response protein AidB-like acyl-CoA dehydrogenase
MSHEVPGMSFDLSEEHLALREHIRSFVAEEVTPVALEFDESQEFPHEIFRKLGYQLNTVARAWATWSTHSSSKK